MRRPRLDEKRERHVELNCPTEALDVDDVDENQGKREPRHETEHLPDHAEEAGLDNDHPANLLQIGTNQAQHRKFAAPLDDQRDERAGHAENRHDDGDRFEPVGDREGAVEDTQDLAPQRGVGVDKNTVRLSEPARRRWRTTSALVPGSR